MNFLKLRKLSTKSPFAGCMNKATDSGVPTTAQARRHTKRHGPERREKREAPIRVGSQRTSTTCANSESPIRVGSTRTSATCANSESTGSSDDNEVFLCIDSRLSLNKVTEELKAGLHRGAKKVRVTSDDPFPQNDWGWSVSRVFIAIGSLPGLEEIVIEEFDCLPVSAVKKLLLESSNWLKRLKFDRCSFVVSPMKRKDQWNGHIRRLRSLESFEMTQCSQKRFGSKEPLSGWALLSELAPLPFLKRLVLAGNVNLPLGDEGEHPAFVFSPSVEEVDLSGVSLCGPLFEAAMQALIKLPGLRNLTFGKCRMDKAGERALVDWLSCNPPLQGLKIVPVRERDENIAFLRHALPEALVNNTHLRQCLVMAPGFFKIPKEVLERWLRLVQQNQVLERVRLCKTSLRMQLRLYDLAKKPSSMFELEEVHAGSTPEEDAELLRLQNGIAYHLQLNRLGRQRLLQDYDVIPKDVLVDALGACSGAVPCLYFFLKLNPAIVAA